MLTPTARRNLSELASRRFKLRLRPADAPVVATWCGAFGSCQEVPSWFVVEQLRALPSRRGRPAGGHSRGARGRRIFGARTRERAISIASTSSARALSRSAPTRSPSEKHGETEIKVARVDASSFATGAREAAARMSANGATTGEGDVRTLWIGDLVRIPSTRLPRRRPRTRPRAAHRSRPLARETAIATSTRRYFSIRPSTPTRRARIETRASLDARARAHHDRLERRRAPSRLAAKTRPRSPPLPTPRNQQQGYWVAEPYLLSCFAHFGACASFSRKRTVCDSRNVPDARVTSTVFFALAKSAVFQHATVHRQRTRFFSSIKKFSDERWFDSSARRFLSENKTRREPPSPSPGRPRRSREYPSIFSL